MTTPPIHPSIISAIGMEYSLEPRVRSKLNRILSSYFCWRQSMLMEVATREVVNFRAWRGRLDRDAREIERLLTEQTIFRSESTALDTADNQKPNSSVLHGNEDNMFGNMSSEPACVSPPSAGGGSNQKPPCFNTDKIDTLFCSGCSFQNQCTRNNPQTPLPCGDNAPIEPHTEHSPESSSPPGEDTLHPCLECQNKTNNRTLCDKCSFQWEISKPKWLTDDIGCGLFEVYDEHPPTCEDPTEYGTCILNESEVSCYGLLDNCECRPEWGAWNRRES